MSAYKTLGRPAPENAQSLSDPPNNIRVRLGGYEEVVLADVEEGPELYFGVVTPLGVAWEKVSSALERALNVFGYHTEHVRLSQLLTPSYDGRHEDDRKEHYIKLGNKTCEEKGTDQAVVHLAIDEIRRRREAAVEAGRSLVFERTAFVLGTLKRPAEVSFLRDLYGPWFLLVAAQDTIEHRMTNLISRIRDSHPAWNDEQARRRAEDLINLDRHQETQPYGQDVLHTFPKADLFVDLIEEDEIDPQIQRLIKILFGETLVPTDEENGMVIAYLTSLRSTSRRRRVGAALTMRARDEQASVVAVGTNEVAHAGGGHPTNPLASEEAHAGIDYSKSRIKRIGADFLKRLRDEDLLSPEFGERTSTSAGIDDAVGTLFHGTHNSAEFEGPMGKAELAKLMEFHHEVHAELSAILDASRRGMPTQDLTLYTTTYPCHLCAKEIVASGISEVVYVEPYPKSAVEAMYEDSIATDRGPDASKITFRWFVGISPARFTELFHVGRPLLREYPDAERRSLNPRVGRGIFQNLTLIERERESH